MDYLETIDSYSRAQAIEDGFLIDVSEWAKASGFKFPAAFADSLYNSIEESAKGPGQSVRGIAMDIFSMLLLKVKLTGGRESTIKFEVLIWDVTKRKPVLEKLKAVVGPGDTPAPVITISFRGED